MRIIRSSALALMLSAAPAAILAVPAHAQVSIDIRVGVAPPPLPYYEQPAIPAEGYIWVPGYWAWDAAETDYYWVPGTWVEPPQRELLWTPAYWGFNEGRYGFHPGYWGREVGFYGGIDYGYGYGGQGYQGGRWNNGAFFYNRSVNNVENVRITNVYNETIVVRNTNERVSFNGGNGGTSVRPTAQQETFAQERHVEATPVQRQQSETASKDRALFSKQNHGEPAIAATPRAGDFKGPGVVRGSSTPVAAKPANAAQPGGMEKPGEKPGEKPAMAPNREMEMPKAGAKPGADEAPRATEPRSGEMSKDAPKADEARKPIQETPKAEERKQVSPPPKAEERRPAEQPKAEERRPAAEPPRAEEPRRPMAEPPRPQERAPERAAEPRPAAPEARPAPAAPPRPAAAPAPAPRPAAPAGKPPAEEKK